MRFIYRPLQGQDVHFLVTGRNGPRLCNAVLSPLEFAVEHSRYTHAESMIYRRGTPAGLLSEFEWFDWISPLVQVCETKQAALDLLRASDPDPIFTKPSQCTVTPGRIIAFAEAWAHPPGDKCNKRRAWYSAMVFSHNLTAEWMKKNLVMGPYVVGTFDNLRQAQKWINGDY